MNAMSKQLQDYNRDGYTVLRGVLSADELELLCSEAERLRYDDRLMNSRNLRAATRASIAEGHIVDRLDPIIDLSPPFEKLARDERLLKPVEEIFGEPAMLMKDKLIFKSPSATGYSPHQDYTGWVELPAPPEAMLSVLVALDSSGAENGGLEIFPGLHQRHYLESKTPQRIFDPGYGLVPEEILRSQEPILLELAAGDVVVFSSLAPHQSGPNRGTTFRKHVYYTYTAATYGDLYDQHYENLKRYLSADREAETVTDQYYW